MSGEGLVCRRAYALLLLERQAPHTGTSSAGFCCSYPQPRPSVTCFELSIEVVGGRSVLLIGN
jgi:hypothetical protein